MKDQVRELFAQIRSRTMIDDINQIDALVGAADPAVLRALSSRCRAELQKALRSGHHIEGRRLGLLAEQLQQRALAISKD